MPLAPAPLLNKIKVLNREFIATSSMPEPKSDYLMEPTIEYLQGTIPDQYALSYWGHGMNSYALNFRYAFGSVAAIVQVSYGGAYGNLDKDSKAWNACIDGLNSVLTLNRDEAVSEPSERNYIVAYSNFRWVDRNQAKHGFAPLLFVKEQTGWTIDYSFSAWDQLSELKLK